MRLFWVKEIGALIIPDGLVSFNKFLTSPKVPAVWVLTADISSNAQLAISVNPAPFCTTVPTILTPLLDNDVIPDVRVPVIEYTKLPIAQLAFANVAPAVDVKSTPNTLPDVHAAEVDAIYIALLVTILLAVIMKQLELFDVLEKSATGLLALAATIRPLTICTLPALIFNISVPAVP